MSEHLFPEVAELRHAVRAIVTSEMAPHAARLMTEGRFPEELVAGFVEAGFLGCRIGEEYGGAGMGLREYCLIQEELARCTPILSILMSSTSGLAPMAIQRHGTAEQKRKYLPPLTRGARTSFALTESEAGSDAAAIRTKATRVDGGWVLNGRKHFISCAEEAALLLVIAVTDKAAKPRERMTGFIVERGAKGLAIPRVDSTFGSPAWTICEVALDDCFVADADVLGPVGAGFGLALEALDEGRLNVASICLGAADALNEESAAYAATRRTFGAPMSERQAIQWMLADSATDIAAARSLIYAALTAAEAGKPIGATASMAKLFSSEMAFRVADRAVQIHGGNGLAAESRIGSVFRDLRIFRVGEGASEIQRMVIARDILRNAAPR